MHRRSVFRTLLVLLCTALGVLAAGCGGTSNSSSSASTTQESGSTSAAPSSDPQKARLQWAACMRENGVQIADPDPSGNVQIVPGQPTPNPQQFQAAAGTCQHLLANVPPEELQPSASDTTELQTKMLRFTRCMRSNGVNVPDPDFSHGATIPNNAFDPNSPTFQKAAAACQKYFPN